MFFDSRDFFNTDGFLKMHNSQNPESFLFKVTETTLFANFIEARSFGKSDQDAQIIFFDG